MTTKRTDPSEYRGTVQEFKDSRGRIYYRARITYPDGERVWLKPRFDKRERAEEYANDKSQEAERRGITVAAPPKPGETCDDYFDRLSTARASEGIDVRKEGYDWGKWISPRIGPRPIAEVTRDEIEDIRNALDAEVKKRNTEGLEAGISGKTAQNIWSVLRTTFKESVGARDRSLRVRTDDPSAGHKPPLTSSPRAKTFIYPVEMSKLLVCDEVPVEWRRTYAVAVYLYARPEELEAMTWRDVDFTARTVSVSKAVDARTGEPKALPKTEAAVREIPIEPNLMPLLQAMHEERESDDAPVVPALRTLNDKFRAKQLRVHLVVADVKRARLTADTLTLRPVDFRSCRDTGITWLALAGHELKVIRRRAGHEDLDTTDGYVKMAEDLSGTVGEPFPPVPRSLLQSSKQCLSSQERAENKCRRRESNREGKADEAPFSVESSTGDPESPKPAGDKPAEPGRLDSGLDAALSADEATLEAKMIAADLAGRETLARGYERRLEALRVAKAAGNVLPFDPQRRKG